MLIDYRAVRRKFPMERVLDLIGYRATSRRDHRLRGACPFHTSVNSALRCFSVDLAKGRFRCFRCGAQGNQLDLWARVRRLPLHGAALDLCHHAGVGIPLLDPHSAGQ